MSHFSDIFIAGGKCEIDTNCIYSLSRVFEFMHEKVRKPKISWQTSLYEVYVPIKIGPFLDSIMFLHVRNLSDEIQLT